MTLAMNPGLLDRLLHEVILRVSDKYRITHPYFRTYSDFILFCSILCRCLLLVVKFFLLLFIKGSQGALRWQLCQGPRLLPRWQ